jgi:hypothetical protein
MSAIKQFDGSRRHVLDWVESPAFLDTVRGWVDKHGLSISANATWMPKSWAESDESKLFDFASPFLPESQKDALRRWWLVYATSANIPNWDVIVAAKTTDQPALVLFEAKAHVEEFDCNKKLRKTRETLDAQARTDANHQKIGEAIEDASRALRSIHSGISISRDCCYQFSNRIAFAWKLASMGITTVLIFLGFTGDREIKKEGVYFFDEAHWQRAFAEYSAASFPLELFGRSIPCGAASFFVLSHSLPVARSSRPYAERKRRPRARTQ